MPSFPLSLRAPRLPWLLGAAIMLLLLGRAGPVRAGGPVGVTAAGQPFHWDAAQPVQYVVDPGALGPLGHAAAVALVLQGLRTWQDVSTMALGAVMAGELPRHLTGSTVTAFLNGLRISDPSPILLDTDGSITDALAGQGASRDTFGFAGPLRWERRAGLIQVSYAVLNGRLVREQTAGHLQLVCSHELGHLIGLDHSQVNAELKYNGDPTKDALLLTMSYRGPNGGPGLHADDQAWISWLYPTAGFTGGTGTIRGRVLLPDGQQTGVQGIHVIARRIGDPQVTAVGAVSGYAFRHDGKGASDPARLGEFVIPGLPPGSYTLEVQELDDIPDVPYPSAYLAGGPKYWRQGSSGQDPPDTSTPIVVGAGREVTGIDIVLNGESLGAPRTIAAQHPNALPGAQKVTLPAVITGTIAGSTGGPTAGPPIDSVDDLQDVYRVSLPEWTVVTAILSAADRAADLDLYVLGKDQDDYFLEGASLEAGTPPEVVQLRLPPGRHFFGVHRAGDQGGAYTLRLLATPAPDPDPEPAAAFINYVLLGEITPTSAMLRWQTSAATPTVVSYNQPQREIGSTRKVREHTLALTDLTAGTRTDVEVYAAAGPRLYQVDQAMVPLKTATDPTSDGSPRIVPASDAHEILPGIAQVVVRLSNSANGDALKVRIEKVTLPPGWELISRRLFGTGLPDPLEVGRVGAGGAASLAFLIYQRSGNSSPKVTVHGSYTDAGGTALTF